MEETRKKENLRLVILEKLSFLATSAFGLVAALAWNDAIQSLFVEFFGVRSTLIAKFIYATVVTILMVIITVRISRMYNDLKHELEENNINDNKV